MANKPMWDWMDKAEGKKAGSSHAAMEKEKVRQGAKSKALHKMGKKEYPHKGEDKLTSYKERPSKSQM